MQQRRKHNRYRVWFPVRLHADRVEGMATSHNIGAGGMLVAVSAKVEAGSIVTVRFRLPPDLDHERTVHGKVVRLEDNHDDPEGMWPYRIAVAFEDIDLELIPVLEAAAKHLAEMS